MGGGVGVVGGYAPCVPSLQHRAPTSWRTTVLGIPYRDRFTVNTVPKVDYFRAGLADHGGGEAASSTIIVAARGL